MARRTVKELRELKEEALKGGGASRIEEQHRKGKLTARERLTILLDEGGWRSSASSATGS
jgi:propionyl-CoA carboxylase beta chain